MSRQQKIELLCFRNPSLINYTGTRVTVDTVCGTALYNMLQIQASAKRRLVCIRNASVGYSSQLLQRLRVRFTCTSVQEQEKRLLCQESSKEPHSRNQSRHSVHYRRNRYTDKQRKHLRYMYRVTLTYSTVWLLIPALLQFITQERSPRVCRGLL